MVNALMQYARTPEIFIQLPSNGNFGSRVQLSPDGELGVCAMNTRDELNLRNPEMLLNGEAILRMIESCCPDIEDVRNHPVCDMEPILLAIRAASSDRGIELNATCPECSHQNEYEIDVHEMLATTKKLEKSYQVELSNGVQVSLKPFTLQDAVKQTLEQFKQARTLDNLVPSEMSTDPNLQKITQALNSIAVNILELTANAIIQIMDRDGNPMDVSHADIVEWLNSISSKDGKKIEAMLTKINDSGMNKEVTLVCSECEHHFKTELSIDQSNFFDTSS